MKHIPSVKCSVIAISILCLTSFNSSARANDAAAEHFMAVEAGLILLWPGTLLFDRLLPQPLPPSPESLVVLV